MSIRTSHEEVEAVLGTSVASGALDGFIADASLWVDNYLEGKCSALPEDKLPTIEKYVAAHLYQISQEGSGGQLIASEVEGVRDRYAERKGDEAGVTTYIRTAAAFDPCGIIAEHWLGKVRLKAYVGAGYVFRGGGL